LTFDVQGSPNDNQSARITSGTVQMTRNPNGTLVCSGYIGGGQFTNNSMALVMDGAFDGGPSCTGTPQYIELKTSCSTSNTNVISLNDDNGIEIGTFSGPVECSKKDTTDTTTQQQQQQSSPPSSSSSPMTASSQDRDSSNRSSSSDSNTNRDGDGDGVPDSSDRCLHTSNPRCFKEAT
ncbi:MAG: hypothetical protein ACJ71B_11935, partial [Nitrososphaera sp.]